MHIGAGNGHLTAFRGTSSIWANFFIILSGVKILHSTANGVVQLSIRGLFAHEDMSQTWLADCLSSAARRATESMYSVEPPWLFLGSITLLYLVVDWFEYSCCKHTPWDPVISKQVVTEGFSLLLRD